MPQREINILGPGKVTVESPAGATLVIPGATAPQPIQIDWKTNDNSVVELEVVIHVVELGGLNPAVYNALRWQVWSLGHGDVTIDFPPPANQNLVVVTKQRIPRWCVPARGVACRFAGRNLQLFLSNEHAGTNPIVQVSIEPVIGSSSGWRPFPNVDAGVRFTNGDRSYFPAHAAEWKLSSIFPGVDQGTPPAIPSPYLIPPEQAITLWQWSSQRTAVKEQVLPAYVLWDWQPIPMAAHSWSPTSTPTLDFIGVLYR
jgi:hypothetical protein